MTAVNNKAATHANQTKIRQAHDALDRLLPLLLEGGFFGSAKIELTVQDGTIQHIRQAVERIEK